MKIYVSVPIGATPESMACSRERAMAAKKAVEGMGHKAVTIFDDPESLRLPYAESVAKGVASIIRCNGVLLLTGWSLCKSCCIEREAARVFRKMAFEHVSKIPAREPEPEPEPKGPPSPYL